MTVEYRPVSRPAEAEAIVPIIEERLAEPRDAGHLLVFLPGLAEIRRVGETARAGRRAAGALVLPLHGSLTAERAGSSAAAQRSPQDHPEHERRRDIVDDRRGEHGDRQRAGADRPLRWRTRHRPLGDEPDQSSLRRPAGRPGGPDRARHAASGSGPSATSAADPNSNSPRSTASTSPRPCWRCTPGAVSDPGNSNGTILRSQSGWPRPSVCCSCWAAWPATRHGSRRWGKPCSPCRSIRGWRGCSSRHTSAGALARRGDRRTALRERHPARTDFAARPTRDTALRHSASGDSDVLDRLELLAEAEAARFGPSLRSRGIDPAAARQVARLRDDLARSQFPSQARARFLRSRDRRRRAFSSGSAGLPRSARQTPGLRGNRADGGRPRRLPRPRIGRARRGPVPGDRRARRPSRRGVLEVQVNLASMVRLEWLEELFPAHLRRERLTRYDESRQRVIGTTRALVSRPAPSRRREPDSGSQRSRSRPGRGPSAASRLTSSGITHGPPSGSRESNS